MSDYQKDYYAILQVHPEAEDEVVQAAFRRLARMYHPDTGNGSTQQMQDINEAYAILSDSRKRSNYDRWYRYGGKRVNSGHPPSATSSPPHAGVPSRSVWRVIIPTALAIILLVVLVLDLSRFGLRGAPEVTLILLLLGWLVYQFGGIKDLWR